MLEPSSSEEDDDIVRHEVDSQSTNCVLSRNSSNQASFKHLHSSVNLQSSSSNLRNTFQTSLNSSNISNNYQQFLLIKSSASNSEKLNNEKAKSTTSNTRSSLISSSSSLSTSSSSHFSWSNFENSKELSNGSLGNTKVDEAERVEKEEQERKQRLQLYVFVIRCISYPFNAKQSTDMVRRPLKVTKSQFESIVSKFSSFVKGELQILCDEAFVNAVNHYYETFLKSEGAKILVNSGACSLLDFKDSFKRLIDKKIKGLPEIDGFSKEALLNSWMTKFDVLLGVDEDAKKPVKKGSLPAANLTSDSILSKEQLYDMFQHVLTIKKFEHQLLFNALQLDSADEQAAAIRRELDGRIQKINEMEKVNNFLPALLEDILILSNQFNLANLEIRRLDSRSVFKKRKSKNKKKLSKFRLIMKLSSQS